MSGLLQLCLTGLGLLLRGCVEQSALAAEAQSLALFDYRASHCPPIALD